MLGGPVRLFFRQPFYHPRLVELGLARFYAHFPYPWEGGLESIPEFHSPWRDKKALKERLERYVMGARYESLYADGKEEPVPSDWDRVYHTGFLWLIW